MKIMKIEEKKPEVALDYQSRIWNLYTIQQHLLLLELRDEDTMTASYDLYDLKNKSYLWKDFSLEEPWRVGVSFTKEDVIIFHQFETGTIPAIERLIAIETRTAKALWQLENLQPLAFGDHNFTALKNDVKISVDYETGSEGDHTLKEEYEEEFKPLLPTTFTEELAGFDTIKRFINKKLEVEPLGSAEYLELKGDIILSYHIQKDKIFKVFLACFNRDGQLWHHELLDSGKNLSSDTFFIWSDYLIFVVGKNRLYGIKVN